MENSTDKTAFIYSVHCFKHSASLAIGNIRRYHMTAREKKSPQKTHQNVSQEKRGEERTDPIMKIATTRLLPHFFSVKLFVVDIYNIMH